MMPPKAADALSASRLTTPMPAMPFAAGAVPVAAGAPYYPHQSPMSVGRISMAPPRFVLQGAPPTAGATFVAAPPARHTLGPSFVAAPKMVFSASAAAPAAYGAPVMPMRPSFVAGQPLTMTMAKPVVAGTVPPVVASHPTVMMTAPSITTTTGLQPGGYITAGSALLSQPVAVAPRAAPAPAPAPAAPAPAPAAPALPPAAPAVSADHVAALEKRLADLETVHACRTHAAFVFIKPHAVNEEVKSFAKEHLATFGISILSEGTITAEDIDQQQLIDTHYGAIAAKAVILLPADLTVSPTAQEAFEGTFGLPWGEALKTGVVFNATQGAEALGITAEELGVRWDTLQKDVDLLKFGGGFYCGKIDEFYIINGFYMNMRAKFTQPGSCIYFFETEWDARQLSWHDFRSKVLGVTDPSTAEPSSLRNLLYTGWEALGLAACPDTGDNGVHASASPFEALAERSNWLAVPMEDDPFGRALLASGIPLSTLQEWCNDPTVDFHGEKASLFDLLEDLNSRECLHKASRIASENASVQG